MAVLRSGAWGVLDPRAGSVTALDRHSRWQMGQGDCSQVTGVQNPDTPLDTGGVKPGKSPLGGDANFFTVERDKEHTAKKGSRGLGMDMSPEGWTWDRFFHIVLS